MSKLHRTALGKSIDMASLRAKNEKVRAVGNMNVNARGDTIDSNNNVIQDANRRVNTMYQKTMQNPMASQRSKPGPNAEQRATPPVKPVKTESVPKPVVTEPDEIYNGAPADFGDDEPNPEK
jgi:hypothetical protein